MKEFAICMLLAIVMTLLGEVALRPLQTSHASTQIANGAPYYDDDDDLGSPASEYGR